MNPGSTPRIPFPSIEGSCLAALAHALGADGPAEGAERLLIGLREPLSLAGALVLLRTGDAGISVLASLDLPEEWLERWRDGGQPELDARVAAGHVREPLGDTGGRIEPELKLSGVRTLWTVPLVVRGEPRGAVVLASRSETAFPRDVHGTVEAVAAAFAGWVEARTRTPPPAERTSTSSTSSSAWDVLAGEPDLAVIRLTSDRRIRNWPRRARQALGWPPEEMVGQEVETLFLDEDQGGLSRRLLNPGVDLAGEWPVDLRAHHGQPVPCGVRVVAPGGAAGAQADLSDPAEGKAADGPVLILRDRRAEEAAEKWLRWSRSLLAVLGVSTVVLDPGGRIRELGSGWLDPERSGDVPLWLGRHFADLLDSDRREVLACLRTAATKGEWTGRLTANGEPVTVTLQAVRDSNGHLEALVGTRRAPAGEETRDLFRQIPLGVVLLDPELQIVETNPELAAICGADALPIDPVGLDVRSLAVFQTRSAQEALDELVSKGEVNLPDVHLRGNAQSSLRVQFRGGPLTDRDGERTGYLLTLLSRTGKADMERHLMRAQKMESIGNLASGLAHDFGNFVAVILGKAGMLRVKLPADPHITGDLTDIETAAKRAQHLAQELMKFARGGRHRVARLEVNHLISEVGALIRTSVGKRIKVELRLTPDAPIISGDEVELQQMIMNLCLNARDAMPNGGALLIETSPLTPEQHAKLSTGDDVTEGVCLVVKDSGEGIAPEVVDRVFEPFFTTKEETQKGTGLGLAMVYGIVRRHGGTIDVYSRPGAGTSFEILLPAAGPGDEADDLQGRRILVVDDEPAFREMIRLILEEDGYRVHLAANGIEALRMLRRSWQELALVILDLRMPGLDGLGVLEEIRSLSERLPVLVTTGYAGEEEKEEAVRRGAAKVLEKPYRVAELRAALGEIFSGGLAEVVPGPSEGGPPQLLPPGGATS